MEVQGTDAGMIGPGSPFVFSTRDGQDWLVYHYYDANSAGDPWLQIRPLTWIGGWPVTGIRSCRSPASTRRPACNLRPPRGDGNHRAAGREATGRSG